MSDAIARYNADIEVDIHYPQVVMRRASDGEWVDYDDHQAEVERLTTERDEAHKALSHIRSIRTSERYGTVGWSIGLADPIIKIADAALAGEGDENE